MKKIIKIGNHKIGPGQRTFIIAEAGVNHNGSLIEAKKLVKSAKLIGADCIKFQTFKTDALLMPNTTKANYQELNTKNNNSQNEMLKRLELTETEFIKLINYCKKIDIEFMSTPYSFEDVKFLNKIGVNSFKLSSMHLTEHFFVNYVLKKNKPVIISTGMSTLNDIHSCMDYIKSVKNKKIILLQCTTNYPTQIQDLNLNNIVTIKNTFNKIVGFSDHSKSNLASYLSVALGGSVIEKHFTLNKKYEGPDHSSSLDPIEFKALVKGIRETEVSLGSFTKKVTKSEFLNANVMKRSIVTVNNLKKGDIIKYTDLTFKRPSNGLEPKFIDLLIGKKLKKNINRNSHIFLKDIL